MVSATIEGVWFFPDPIKCIVNKFTRAGWVPTNTRPGEISFITTFELLDLGLSLFCFGRLF